MSVAMRKSVVVCSVFDFRFHVNVMGSVAANAFARLQPSGASGCYESCCYVGYHTSNAS